MLLAVLYKLTAVLYTLAANTAGKKFKEVCQYLLI